MSSTLNSGLPVTVSEIGGAVLIALVVGISLGVAGAVLRGRLGKVFDMFSLAGLAIPAFWLGYLLVLLFADRLRWLPAVGYVESEHVRGSLGEVVDLTGRDARRGRSGVDCEADA